LNLPVNELEIWETSLSYLLLLQKARVLRKQGLSFRRIEKQLGVGEGTIRKRIKTLEIKP